MTSDGRRAPLLLIEDDPDIGPMTAEMLGDDYEVTLITDGRAGYEAAAHGDFAAIVLDRRLPGLDGVQVLQRLRRTGHATPVIMLTALGTLDARVEGLDAGADDYLTKPFEVAELLARLRAITRVHPTEAPLFIGGWEFRPRSRLINSPYEGRIVLTETESLLLHLLVSHPDETISRERILREVFSSGEHAGVVDTYVHYIRRKTEHDIITTVRGRGYRIGVL